MVLNRVAFTSMTCGCRDNDGDHKDQRNKLKGCDVIEYCGQRPCAELRRMKTMKAAEGTDANER